jgi:hypothetical protein
MGLAVASRTVVRAKRPEHLRLVLTSEEIRASSSTSMDRRLK